VPAACRWKGGEVMKRQSISFCLYKGCNMKICSDGLEMVIIGWTVSAVRRVVDGGYQFIYRFRVVVICY